MSKFKKINLTVRPLLLEKLLFEYMSGHAPSRSSTADTCCVSTVTSGKVANALLDSGFMVGKIFSTNEKRPCKHLLFSDKASILLIELSTSVYKMSVVSPDGKISLCLSHTYDPEVSFDDNLNIFISRNGLKLKRSRIEFAAISVIYADEGRREQLERRNRISCLPPIILRDYIDSVIFTILGKRVTTHLTVSEAIREAVKFRAIDIGASLRGISSVFIGTNSSSFHVYPSGSVTVCSPENILSKEELADIDNIRLIPKEKADALFVHISDFMDSAFSPSVLLLDSDIFNPDLETAERISRKFTLTSRQAPIIYTRNSSFPLAYLGAARCTIFSLAKKYIVSDKV